MQLGELAHIVEVQRMAEDGMVRAAGDDPGFRRGTQIRLRFPQGVGHRQLRQIVRRWDGFDGIDQQTEAVSQVDQAGDDRRAGLRIGFSAVAIVGHTSSMCEPSTRSLPLSKW